MVAPAAWCPVKKKKELGPDCDGGVGIQLYRVSPQWSILGVVGTKTVGVGIGYKVAKSIQIGAGVAVEYDGNGLYTDDIYPTVGATISLWGKR